MKMKAPANSGGASVGGVEIVVGEDGSAEVPDQFVDALRGHGFTDWRDAPASAPADDPNAPPAPVADEFDGMTRNGLFAWLKANGVSVQLPQSLDSLRALCRAAKAPAGETASPERVAPVTPTPAP